MFNLSEDFIKGYENKEVDWGPLGEVTYLRTYSRNKEDGSKERWFETVKRVVEGCYLIQKEHCQSLKLPWSANKAQKSAQIMYEKIFSFKFTPSGRGLWMMGTPFVKEKGCMALLNCAIASTNEMNVKGSFPFTWTMDALMMGVGVSYDTLGAGKITIKQPKETDVNFEIPDSREGWVESLRYVLDGYFHGNAIPHFDYSKIRPYGAPIKGFGGVASGPEPLKNLLEGYRKVLDPIIGQKITSVNIVDLMDMIGVCVVAGNVRRSALLALGSWDDEANKFPKEVNEYRWSSNNSIRAEVGKTDYKKISENICINGEPGLIWLDNIRTRGRMADGYDTKDKYAVGLNPCGEIVLEDLELCNLVESFPSRHESYEEYKTTLKYAYLYAKTVTLIPTHVPETNAVMMKNRRIGISQSGIIDAFVRHGRRSMMQWNDNG
jgi:ribonucleoside-triphosphate reductase